MNCELLLPSVGKILQEILYFLKFYGRPVRIELSDFKVLRYPSTRPNGSSWDPNSGPDLYIRIEDGPLLLWESNPPIENPGAAPFDLDIGPPISIDDFTKRFFAVNMYDANSTLLFNEFMGGALFEIYLEERGFPPVLEVDINSPVAFSFAVTYYFN